MEIYQIYCGSKYKFIASKKYFEKFIKEESELFITEDNFIKVKSFRKYLKIVCHLRICLPPQCYFFNKLNQLK